MLKTLFGGLSRAGTSARLSVLIFHRVLLEIDPLFPDEIDASRFDLICGWLKSWFNVLPLDKAVAHLNAGTLPGRAACITFDDGYADNFQVALPILQRHGLTATFFISTGFLDGGRMWNDTIIESVRALAGATLDGTSAGLGRYSLDSVAQSQQVIGEIISKVKYLEIAERVKITETLARAASADLPKNLMMTSTEVKRLFQAGMQIGAHTVSHPILARLSGEEAKREIQNSKVFLEELLGERVGLFAYPNGKPGEDYSPQTVDTVRKLDFDAAVSTTWGVTSSGDDLLQIRRFTPWDKSKGKFGLRLLANLRAN
jgi:peptidoglycan/xylan/chitin deacetylase (PgdA/CDA1 family)